MSTLIDVTFLYMFIRRLTTPFREWEAYRLGIIDDAGNILINQNQRKTNEMRKAFTKFDLLVLKLKKLLSKIPGGNTLIASYAAALWLIKEGEEAAENIDMITEDDVLEAIGRNMALAESFATVDERYELFEETTQAASNVVDHSIAKGMKLGKKKPAEEGTPELVRRYSKTTPGQRDFKEAMSYGGYRPEPVGKQTRSADISNARAKIKTKVTKTKDKNTGIVKTSKKTTRSLSGGRDHVVVGHDNAK